MALFNQQGQTSVCANFSNIQINKHKELKVQRPGPLHVTNLTSEHLDFELHIKTFSLDGRAAACRRRRHVNSPRSTIESDDALHLKTVCLTAGRVQRSKNVWLGLNECVCVRPRKVCDFACAIHKLSKCLRRRNLPRMWLKHLTSPLTPLCILFAVSHAISATLMSLLMSLFVLFQVCTSTSASPSFMWRDMWGLLTAHSQYLWNIWDENLCTFGIIRAENNSVNLVCWFKKSAQNQ